VDGQSTFAQRLERNLGNIPESTRRFAVINAGVTGYGTAQEMLQYELKGRQFDPDLVILSIFMGNDVQDNLCLNLKSLTPHRRAPCFVLEGNELILNLYPLPPSNDEDQERPGSSLAKALSSTELYKLVHLQSQKFAEGNPWTIRFLRRIGIYIHPGYLPHVVEGWYLPGRAKLGFPLTQELLMRLNREVEESGARLAVVLIPSRIQVLPRLLELSKILYPDVPEVRAFFEDPHKPQRMLVNFLHEKNVPVLDLLPLLKNHPNVDSLYLPINAHWNELGHELAAEAIEEFLYNEQLIPEPGD